MESTQGVNEYRLSKWLAVFIAIAVSLPMAWISLSKLALVVFALSTTVQSSRFKQRWRTVLHRSDTKTILLLLSFAAVSLIWTLAPITHALNTLLKHAKLLWIPLLVLLLWNKSISRMALFALSGSQAVVLLLSWLMLLGFSPFHPINPNLGPVVFSESYIDQSAMFGITAALAWHFRHEGLWPQKMGALFAALALLNVVLLLPGRTGYLIAAGVITLATLFELPVRWRWTAVVLIPALTLCLAFFVSNKFRVGMERALSESYDYTEVTQTSTSSGWRLNAWHRSLQAISAKPLHGYGVGSFVPAVKAYETGDKEAVFGKSLSSNPHQEFLLWGVELGITGMMILISLIWIWSKHAMGFNPAACRATLSILITVTIACLFNSALYDDQIGDFLCVALGICLAYGRTHAPTGTIHNDGL